jgi:hypothetical protein
VKAMTHRENLMAALSDSGFSSFFISRMLLKYPELVADHNPALLLPSFSRCNPDLNCFLYEHEFFLKKAEKK